MVYRGHVAHPSHIDTSIHAESLALLKKEAIHCQTMAASYSHQATVLRISEGWNTTMGDRINYIADQSTFWSNLARVSLFKMIGDDNGKSNTDNGQ